MIIVLAYAVGVERLLSHVLGQDVSKLAAREKQLLLSRLLARLAHEIRNPLSSLDIHVQLLAEDLAGADPGIRTQAGRRLEIIRGELHRLNGVVTHFLNLAAPSSLDLQTLDLRHALEHVRALLGPEAEARGIELTAALVEPVPTLVADPVKLTQALLNLVINALQATPRGGEVRLSAIPAPEIQSVSLVVQDTGPGVPVDRRSAVFEPFFTTKAEGNGLGLWIVQQIVLAHGGRVTVGSTPSGGALFEVQIPLHPPATFHGSNPD